MIMVFKILPILISLIQISTILACAANKPELKVLQEVRRVNYGNYTYPKGTTSRFIKERLAHTTPLMDEQTSSLSRPSRCENLLNGVAILQFGALPSYFKASTESREPNSLPFLEFSCPMGDIHRVVLADGTSLNYSQPAELTPILQKSSTAHLDEYTSFTDINESIERFRKWKLDFWKSWLPYYLMAAGRINITNVHSTTIFSFTHHVFQTRIIRPSEITMKPYFLRSYRSLPKDYAEHEEEYIKFFNTYGTHYVDTTSLGARVAGVISTESKVSEKHSVTGLGTSMTTVPLSELFSTIQAQQKISSYRREVITVGGHIRYNESINFWSTSLYQAPVPIDSTYGEFPRLFGENTASYHQGVVDYETRENLKAVRLHVHNLCVDSSAKEQKKRLEAFLQEEAKRVSPRIDIVRAAEDEVKENPDIAKWAILLKCNQVGEKIPPTISLMFPLHSFCLTLDTTTMICESGGFAHHIPTPMCIQIFKQPKCQGNEFVVARNTENLYHNIQNAASIAICN